ncbi:Protein FAM127A, partial [Microtus ochrogaster]
EFIVHRIFYMFMDNKIFVINSDERMVTFIIITHLRGQALQWVIPFIEKDRPCSAITGAS